MQNNTSIMLDLEVTNHSGQSIGEFDIMFNKNPFGLAIFNVANAFTYP
jgi:hypothetical protein